MSGAREIANLLVRPLVVGTCHPDVLGDWALRASVERPADLIEARIDLMGDGDSTTQNVEIAHLLDPIHRLESSGTPVLATIRLVRDGGRCGVDRDRERLELFQGALKAASWVDIEVESAIAGEVVAAARARGRRVIVSHHDMAETPPLATLATLVDRALQLGAEIVKIATMVNALADHDTLIELMRGRRGAPLAVIAMGALGAPLRSYLPCVGSRLTYGYLDRPVAPGQPSAAELVARLRADCPAYGNPVSASPGPPPH